ncbi:hypothetical protein CALVIDRAFT_535683 [Calocera viscosa TUFC12733]|uniref:Uncharacterized protein n=1 Tax=Calocera viscosa (strain TUFC12733) TaxID=1330018 RepID=A0A167NUE7_CALVF|nr:hypothetical protein CALVIDRAFT_535683 [Calocera viscosa TUFC12733]
MSSSTTSSTITPAHPRHVHTPSRPAPPPPPPPVTPARPPTPPSSRIPITPSILRNIFASSRSLHEERAISRIAFFRFAGFILSCLGIAWLGASKWKLSTLIRLPDAALALGP